MFTVEPPEMEVEEELAGSKIVLATVRDYVNAALYRSLYTTKQRTILYVNECDTLDLECEEIFSKDISWLTIYHAMEERDYLQKRYLSPEEDFDA